MPREALQRGDVGPGDPAVDEEGRRRHERCVVRREERGRGRDLYKLDLVETTLASVGHGALDAMDELTEHTARAIAKHARVQSSRTLLFVFGDHGFSLGRDGVPSSGGSTPEEVLVPAFAFLMGEAH